MAERLGKRQRFIACINRNLERVLNVEQDYSGASDSRQSEQQEESSSTIMYEDDYEKFFRMQRRINEVRRLLLLIPRGMRTRLHDCEPLQRLREALRDLRLDQLPGELINQLNELNLL